MGRLQNKNNATNTSHSGNQNTAQTRKNVTHCITKPEQQQSNALTKAHQKVVKLHQNLQAAELQEAVVKKATSICVIHPKEVNNQDGPHLGPIVMTHVVIEGSTVEALMDTGSPIKIASVECLLDILEKHC